MQELESRDIEIEELPEAMARAEAEGKVAGVEVYVVMSRGRLVAAFFDRDDAIDLAALATDQSFTLASDESGTAIDAEAKRKELYFVLPVTLLPPPAPLDLEEEGD